MDAKEIVMKLDGSTVDSVAPQGLDEEEKLSIIREVFSILNEMDSISYTQMRRAEFLRDDRIRNFSLLKGLNHYQGSALEEVEELIEAYQKLELVHTVEAPEVKLPEGSTFKG